MEKKAEVPTVLRSSCEPCAQVAHTDGASFAAFATMLVPARAVIKCRRLLWKKTSKMHAIRLRLRKMAEDVFSIFEQCGVFYWTDFGTLLGIVRDNDIILGKSCSHVSSKFKAGK